MIPFKRVTGGIWLRSLAVVAATLMVLVFLFPRGAGARDVLLPLTLDYPFLNALMVQSAFPGPGHEAVLIDEEDGCRRIILSNPVFREDASSLLFEIQVSVRLGFTVFGICFSPVEWEGYLVLEQAPVISRQWGLSFITRNSTVLDNGRRPARIAGFIWDFANPPILDYLSRITLDLSAPVDDIRSFLIPLFPPTDAERADRFLKSMRPGTPEPTPTAVRVPILADIAEVEREAVEEGPLTLEERERFIEGWQTWDAFLVQIITALAPRSLTSYEEDLLLDVLLETRHRFFHDLDREDPGRDMVREMFVYAWSRLSPLFRAHLTQGSTRSLLGYLSFFAGSDALVALDALGPGLGIDISRDGLIRLARFLIQERPVSLDYTYALDQTLRDTLGLGPGPIPSFPLEAPPPEGDLRVPEGKHYQGVLWVQDKGRGFTRWFSLFRTRMVPLAWAEGGQKQKWLDEIKSWVVPAKKDLLPYIERVQALLHSSLREVLAKDSRQAQDAEWLRTLVMATAWQESCFRQFVVKKRMITYLRSYNGTSVGIMQINERVWRGMYTEESLRWDIRYNTTAGCEILHLYLTKYALKRIQPPEGDSWFRPDNRLAQAVYAMYNAGPAALGPFLKRSAQGAFTNLDRLFNKKFAWVKQEDFEKITLCY